MKVAFPTQADQGLQSHVYSHFGSAGFFIIVETDDGRAQGRPNADLGHQHGKCQPLAALGGNAVDAVVVGGIGRGALGKLQRSGVKVYRAVEGTVQENLDLIVAGRLPEFSADHTCAGHEGPGGCQHTISS